MTGLLRRLFGTTEPTGAPELVRRFDATEHPIARSGVTAEADGFRVDAESGVLRPALRSLGSRRRAMPAELSGAAQDRGLEEGAYLELWCRLQGVARQGERDDRLVVARDLVRVEGESACRPRQAQPFLRGSRNGLDPADRALANADRVARAAAVARLQLRAPQGFPSGQRGRAVNPLAQPSEVRILPPASSSPAWATVRGAPS